MVSKSEMRFIPVRTAIADIFLQKEGERNSPLMVLIKLCSSLAEIVLGVAAKTDKANIELMANHTKMILQPNPKVGIITLFAPSNKHGTMVAASGIKACPNDNVEGRMTLEKNVVMKE